jgi:type III secretory pathway component EscS
MPFMPVCPENSVQTFYSPCHAGCGAEIFINNIRVFGNCSCGVDIELPVEDSIATEGACGMSDCQPYWIAFQALIVISSALIASTLVGKLIISIRAVLPQDKSLAISIELLLVGIVAFIPGKMLYDYIAEQTCQYFAPDQFRCFLHESPLFGNWMNVTTAGLIVIGIVFEVILLWMIGDLFLYGDDENEDVYRPIEMNTYRNGDSLNPPENVEQPTVNTALLESIIQSNQPPTQTSPGGVTYAQIQRHNAANNQNLDFRLQSPVSESETGSLISDYRTVTSSNGYVNLMNQHNNNNINNSNRPNIVLRNRPQSPETSF